MLEGLPLFSRYNYHCGENKQKAEKEFVGQQDASMEERDVPLLFAAFSPVGHIYMSEDCCIVADIRDNFCGTDKEQKWIYSVKRWVDVVRPHRDAMPR